MKSKSTFKSVLPDILSFFIGLAIAYFLQWEIRDIVWSLWLSSICIGFLSIIIAISTFAYGWLIHANRGKSEAATNSNSKSKSIGPTLLLFLLGGSAFVAFFSIHFGGFHLVHSVFLNTFFPLAGLEVDLLNYVFDQPSKLFSIFYFYIFQPYALFLLPTIIAERNHLFRPLKIILDKKSEKKLNFIVPDHNSNSSKTNSANEFQNLIVRPYKNVIRMHLLIFFFAFCYFFKIDSFIIFAVVYAVYFFPWNILKKQRKAILQNELLENM